MANRPFFYKIGMCSLHSHMVKHRSHVCLLHVPADHGEGEGLEGRGVVLVREGEDVRGVAGLHPVDQLLLTHVLQVVQPVPVSCLHTTFTNYGRICLDASHFV